MDEKLRHPHIGDIVSVSDSDYLAGSVSDMSKLELQVFDWDPRDKHYQLHYKDLKGMDWNIWVPKSLISLRWDYNFWLKRKKLIELLRKIPFSEYRRDMLREDKYGW